MSKKNKENKKNKKIEEQENQEKLSKGEKIFYGIIISLGVIAIITVIVIFAIKGKTDPIIKQYDNLKEDHRIVEIVYEDFIDMINDKKEFQIVLGNNTLEDAKYYMYYANELCENYEIEVIYYLNSSELSTGEKKYFKQDLMLTNAIFEDVNLIYFKNGVIASHTSSGEMEEYGNCWDQLVAYYIECYGELNDE